MKLTDAGNNMYGIARSGYEDPEISSIVGKVDIAVAPVKAGMEPKYGFGGRGIGVSADLKPAELECAGSFQ